MFFVPKGFQFPPRGSKKTFPVQLAPDGTLCILASPRRTSDFGETIIVFPKDGADPATYPTSVEGKNLVAVEAGDFLGVYNNTANGTMIQSFCVDTVDPDQLTATLADILLIDKGN